MLCMEHQQNNYRASLVGYANQGKRGMYVEPETHNTRGHKLISVKLRLKVY